MPIKHSCAYSGPECCYSHAPWLWPEHLIVRRIKFSRSPLDWLLTLACVRGTEGSEEQLPLVAVECSRFYMQLKIQVVWGLRKARQRPAVYMSIHYTKRKVEMGGGVLGRNLGCCCGALLSALFFLGMSDWPKSRNHRCSLCSSTCHCLLLS